MLTSRKKKKRPTLVPYTFLDERRQSRRMMCNLPIDTLSYIKRTQPTTIVMTPCQFNQIIHSTNTKTDFRLIYTGLCSPTSFTCSNLFKLLSTTLKCGLGTPSILWGFQGVPSKTGNVCSGIGWLMVGMTETKYESFHHGFYTLSAIKHLKGKILSRGVCGLICIRGLLRSLKTTVLLYTYTQYTAQYQYRVFVFWLFKVLSRAEDHLETTFKLEPIPCNDESCFIFFQPFFLTLLQFTVLENY